MRWILNKSSCSVLMCKLCPVKQQTDVSVSGKVPGYQAHFVRIVDYLPVPLKKKCTARTIFNMNLWFKTLHQEGKKCEFLLFWEPEKNQSPRLASLAELVIDGGFALSLLISVLDLQITLTLSSSKIWQDSQHYLLLLLRIHC